MHRLCSSPTLRSASSNFSVTERTDLFAGCHQQQNQRQNQDQEQDLELEQEQCTVCIRDYAVCSVKYAVCSVACALFSLQCLVCSVYHTAFNVQCAVCGVQFELSIVCIEECASLRVPSLFAPDAISASLCIARPPTIDTK